MKARCIHLDWITFKIKGELVRGIKVYTKPILYRYANAKNMIIRTPTHLLNTPVNKTPDHIILQAYLERRIAIMRNSKLSNVITFSGILEQLKKSDLARIEKKRIVDTIIKILDFWKKEGMIKGYTVRANKKRSVQGFLIL